MFTTSNGRNTHRRRRASWVRVARAMAGVCSVLLFDWGPRYATAAGQTQTPSAGVRHTGDTENTLHHRGQGRRHSANVFGWIGPAGQTSQDQKVVYFTFDDGPSIRYTPQILEVLRQYHVQATFFVLGTRCDQSPALVREIYAEGHEIGSHGYDHRFINTQPMPSVASEVERADEAIFRACGSRPLYYRPPGGKYRRDEEATIVKLGHPIALWSVDSKDWCATSSQSIIDNVERETRPGAIILFHDGVSSSRYTLQALPTIIEDLEEEGYSFALLPLRPPVG